MLEILGDYSPENREPAVDSSTDTENVSAWDFRRGQTNGSYPIYYMQTRTALMEGAIVDRSVGIRLDQNGKDLVEVLELVNGEWKIVQILPFQTELNYILTKENPIPDFPNEIRFGSHRIKMPNGKKNMRFNVGDRSQAVVYVRNLDVTFPASPDPQKPTPQ